MHVEDTYASMDMRQEWRCSTLACCHLSLLTSQMRDMHTLTATEVMRLSSLCHRALNQAALMGFDR